MIHVKCHPFPHPSEAPEIQDDELMRFIDVEDGRIDRDGRRSPAFVHHDGLELDDLFEIQ